jgi:hypothetical protein
MSPRLNGRPTPQVAKRLTLTPAQREELDAARAGDTTGLILFEFNCRNPRCPVDPFALVGRGDDPTIWQCPRCGSRDLDFPSIAVNVLTTSEDGCCHPKRGSAAWDYLPLDLAEVRSGREADSGLPLDLWQISVHETALVGGPSHSPRPAPADAQDRE